MLEKNCFVCSKQFKTYPSKILLGKSKYCSKECAHTVTDKVLKNNGEKTRFNVGEMPANFKGYSFTKARKNSGVYKMIYKPDHPFSNKKGQVREHRLVMEKKLGRYLGKEEIVHHLNENTLDNREENLQVMLKVEHDRMNTPLNVHKRWQKIIPKEYVTKDSLGAAF